jgi:V-type H+-transporting ATPase subunit C
MIDTFNHFSNSGNLSVRSLGDIVKKENFIEDSEYLETLLVAVPKLVSLSHFDVDSAPHRNFVREWNSKYERLTQMIVPRSSTLVQYPLLYIVTNQDNQINRFRQ